MTAGNPAVICKIHIVSRPPLRCRTEIEAAGNPAAARRMTRRRLPKRKRGRPSKSMEMLAAEPMTRIEQQRC